MSSPPTTVSNLGTATTAASSVQATAVSVPRNESGSEEGAGETQESGGKKTSEYIRACQVGDVAKVKYLIDSGKANPQQIEPDGTTALHWAAINNRLQVCQFLIDSGASVDVKGGALNATPLHWAARNGLVYIVHLLLQRGADPLRTDSQGYNGLHLAVHSSNVLLVIYLLHQGVPTDALDPAGRTGLHWAAYQGDGLTVDALLKWGADVKIKDSLGFTALHWAIVRGNIMCLRRLIEEGSDLNMTNNDGKSPLVMAREMHTQKQYLTALKMTSKNPDGTPIKQFCPDKVLNVFVFFVPPVLVPLCLYFIELMPWYFSVPASIFTLYVSSEILRRFVIPSKISAGPNPLLRTPYFAGIFFASALWTLICYIWDILPVTVGTAPFTNFVFIFLFCIVMYTFFRAMLMDPGYVPRLSSVAEQRQVIETLMDLGKYDAQHFCVSTYIRKPLRSKYDKASGKVIARFDHYCPWIYNCIGIRNHRIFVVFSFSLMVAITLLEVIYFRDYVAVLPVGDSDQCLLPGLCAGFANKFFLTEIMIWDVLQATWLTMVVIVQLIQIARGITTEESKTMQRFGRVAVDEFSSLPVDHSSVNASSLLDSVKQQAEEDAAADQAQNESRRAGAWGMFLRVVGIDQFLKVTRFATRGGGTSNPGDYGIFTNCLDFWAANGGYNVLKVPYKGHASLGGRNVDYYALWEYPRRESSGYESLA